VRPLHLAALAACALSCTSCTAIKATIMAHRLTRGLYAIDGYRAQVRERGILRDDPKAEVVKQLTYGRTWRVRAEVTAPADHAGELFVYDGRSIKVWWPRFFFGLDIEGVPPPSRRDVKGAILADSFWALKHYDYEDEGPLRQAGRPVVRWRGTPRRKEPLVYPYRAWLDREYDVPLKLRVKKDGATWYDMTVSSIAFGETPPDEAFAFTFPKGATVHRWDLDAPGVSLEEAQRRCRSDFPVLVPAELPRGHSIQKVVVGGGEDVHRVALLMNRGGRWLSLTELPNMGPILVPELGIPVAVGERQGILNFVFGFTIVSWAEGNTALTLIGNLPYPQMLAVAASVGPPRVEED
jgi:hypothetical protein